MEYLIKWKSVHCKGMGLDEKKMKKLFSNEIDSN